MGEMDELFDVWLYGFERGQLQPALELQRVFGIDADRAHRFVSDTLLIVKHAVPRQLAESMAAALRSIGGEVAYRPAVAYDAAARGSRSSLPPKPPIPWRDRGPQIVAVGRPSSPPRLFMPLSTPPVAAAPKDGGGSMLGYKALFAFVVMLIFGLGFEMWSRRGQVSPSQADRETQTIIKTRAVDARSYLERGDLLTSTATSEHLRPVVEGLYQAGAEKVWAVPRRGQSGLARYGGVLFIDGLIVEVPTDGVARSAIARAYAVARPSNRQWDVPALPEPSARYWRINVP